jgi:hypothetical protein
VGQSSWSKKNADYIPQLRTRFPCPKSTSANLAQKIRTSIWVSSRRSVAGIGPVCDYLNYPGRVDRHKKTVNMFKPTTVLQKSQARLRGQRGPAIRVLRKSSRTVNPEAFKAPMLTPEHGKSPVAAWNEMGTPIHKLMPDIDRRVQIPEFARNKTPQHQAGLLSWQDAKQRDLKTSIQEAENLPSIVSQKLGRLGISRANLGRTSS